MTNILIKRPSGQGDTAVIDAPREEIDQNGGLNLKWLRKRVVEVASLENIPHRLIINHKYISPEAEIYMVGGLDFVVVEIVGLLFGGKGGFGTLLRGKGARGARTTNFESSRDLLGRRLRNAKAADRMRSWVQRKAQERAVIKAVGGQDKFLGKSLSSKDVIKLYNIVVPSGAYNPFEGQQIDNQPQVELRNSATTAAALAISQIDGGVEVVFSSPAKENPSRPDDHLNALVDVLEDFSSQLLSWKHVRSFTDSEEVELTDKE